MEVRGYCERSSQFILVNEERKVNTMRPRIYINLEEDKTNAELDGAMD